MANQVEMTNCRASVSDAMAFRRNALQLFVLRHSFDLRASSFLLAHSSSAWRIASFSAAIFFPIKTSSVRSVSNGSKSQRPATKLKSCAATDKRTKPFARTMHAGKLSANRSKQSREKILSELNANDSNSG